ncbi:MAG: hypothetical protein Q7S50_04295 [bacterium]|nr:hypothetical protein [bacterium]
MQPLSRLKRRIYLLAFITLFFLCLPFVFFYAGGYRFKSGLGFVQTGGIFISVPYSDAHVSLNGEEIGTSGILNRGFYLDNLTPGAYALHVSREGDYPWYRTLVVEQQLVTDVRALLVPKEIIPIRLLTGTNTGASSTAIITPPTALLYRSAFDVPVATTTEGTRGAALYVEHGDVYVRIDAESSPPSNFCGRPSYCVREIPIERGKQTSRTAAFFGGGIVYATIEGGVFLGEADIRPTAITVPLYPRAGADFRIVNGHLIVKDGSALYEISL